MRRVDCKLPIVCVLLGAAGAAAASAEHLLPPSAKQPLDPIVCEENRDLVIRERSIWTQGDGIVVSGNCDLEIVDSHVLAGGVAIRADGNAGVTIVGSFVQGRAGAVYADGNAEVEYRDSTLRGGVGAEGNADLSDGGGNRFERIPASAGRALSAGEAISCGDRDRITVVHRYVETGGDGVVLDGDCELLLSDSHVLAGGAAVRVRGAGSIRLRNSTLDGGGYAVLIEGDGIVRAAGTNLAGAIDHGLGRFVDGGGNAYGLEAPAVSGGPAVGPSRSRGGAGVTIGPGGVEVRGRGGEGAGRVKVGPGGIEIEASGDGVPRQPIEDCDGLCEIWPALTSSREECVAAVVEALGYPIEETAECFAVETEAQCRVCAATIRVRDRACRTAYDRCMAR